ncbi:MAG TPA: helix-turn-helix domain-containing protein [Pelagibacterium sp.]|uniref:helix-turn-helix domain-containing protein n=1 Tax=Pelagibacterium sp. TaxID=1967288 RepID=UPI002C5224C8|nr:helix-turn-helix domain-containing protein [Pelagibacterium sp.]HWJ87193.1 helix-turn-helix domain-containing protein [Pelagibacterium sp.]
MNTILSAASPRSRLDRALELETQAIGSTLDTAQWSLHGRRNRIFVLVAGTGTVRHAGEEALLQAPTLVWIPVGQGATLTLHAGSRGAWLAIGEAVLGQLVLPGNIGEDLRRLATRPQLGTRIDRSVADRLAILMQVMETELRDGHTGAEEMVRHHLAIVCILLWRHSDLVPVDPQPAPRAIVANFLRLVDQRMRSHWTVADYASYLGVTTDRLNSAVQRATGRSPLAIIHARLHTEARQMLETSGMHIAQIASVLGFEDPAYFSRFFKRLNSKSPRQYRADFVRGQTRISGSFAAWP